MPDNMLFFTHCMLIHENLGSVEITIHIKDVENINEKGNKKTQLTTKLHVHHDCMWMCIMTAF